MPESIQVQVLLIEKSHKNRGTPNWMVKIMEKPYFLMDDLGGKPTIFGNPQQDLGRFEKNLPTSLQGRECPIYLGIYEV